MNEVLEKISKIGIVPVVVLDDAKDAEPLAEANQGWSSLCRSYIQNSCSRRIYQNYGTEIP